MMLIVPLLTIGVLLSAAWAADDTTLETPVTPTPLQMAMAERLPADAADVRFGDADASEGLGAYLQGAVSDLNGDPADASRGYLTALADDPDNLALRERVLELALMGGDIPTALRLAKSLPEVNQNTMSRLVQAVDFAHEGKVADARKQLRSAAKTAPGLLQFELFLAYLDFANGTKVAKLVERLQEMPIAPSLEGRRQYHIARLWLKAGEPDKALVALERSHTAEPSAIFTVLLLGETYARQGMPDKAAALYEDFSAKNPAVALLVPSPQLVMDGVPAPFASTLDEDISSTLFDFGLLVWGEGALGPARQLINLALWLDPQQVYFRYYSGILLELGGDLASAEKTYAALASDPHLGLAAQLRLAEVTFKRGDKARGWALITRLAKEYPEILVLHRSMAQLAFEKGDFSRAVEEYSFLIDRLPVDAPPLARIELLYARGAAYERDGDYDKAATDLQAALLLDPANAQIMNYLGYMWVDRGERLPEAFNLLKKAHLLAPQDGAITDSLGWAYFKRGDYELALKYLELATEQDPESPEIVDHLADAYAKNSKKEEAVKHWNRALELLTRGAEEPRPNFKREVEKKIKTAR